MGHEVERREMITLLFDRAYSFNTLEDWTSEQDRVTRWFASLKVEESDETFQNAFRDSRMTLRAIKEDRQEGHYTEKVPIRGQEDQGGVRTIKTMQGVAGVKERMNSANFLGAGMVERAKYTKGLFDVSGVLLDGKRSLKIGGEGDQKNQMYRLSGDTTYIFMPVAKQQDMHIFGMLNELARGQSPGAQALKSFVQYMKARLTRIKLAFEGDAGCKFLDFAPAGALEPKFRYGFGKLMKGDISVEEVKRRKIAALKYKDVLLGHNRNEIVIAYRQHGTLSKPSCFPIFAKGVFAGSTHKGFVVVTDDMKPKAEIITTKGEMRSGTPADLGGVMTTPTIKKGD